MKVLYVVGSCLTKNTSANMSHNGYVQGLLENQCEVDILMAEDSWGQQDAGLPAWKEARYYVYPADAVQDRIRKKIRRAPPLNPAAADPVFVADPKKVSAGRRIKAGVRELAKRAFYACFPQDPRYPLEKTWLKNAGKFHSDTEYDLVISNSSPAASHKLVLELMRRGRLKARRWIQIWEDPWYFDLYGGHSETIQEEEHNLLRAAGEIYYVSPLTQKYQQRYYDDCAHKMKHIPLPYFDFATGNDTIAEDQSFGYFGDYYSHTRNLLPFYEALKKSGYRGYIYGDTDVSLQTTEQIEIRGRVTLDRLDKVQAKTGVLVHLCNLHGGQIPGKIYHYSATEKPILFILDGTAEEQQIIRAYFSQFERYCFCENNTESILRAIQTICGNQQKWTKLDAFSPQEVVKQLL